MKIQIKALKVSRFASEETLCFQAKVYLDGKLRAYAENDGHGGATFVHPTEGGRATLSALIDEHAASIVAEDFRRLTALFNSRGWTLKEGNGKTPEQAFDDLVDSLVEELDEEKQNAAWQKKGVVYRHAGEIQMRGYKQTIVGRPDEAELRAKLRAEILADQPDAEIIEPNPTAGVCILD